nr:sulfatase-like hydrolase/transferase [uncultured Sellimonas sp.]
MKKIHFTKPDIKGKLKELRHMSKADIKEKHQRKKERRERILEERRNSAFARKMAPVYRFMNRFSLIFHALWAMVINFVIEVISRHSFFEAWEYMTETPLVFFYNSFMIFVTFSVVYLFRRRVFTRILISVLWIALGVINGAMLLKRVTPFNAQDLKALTEGLSLFTNYFAVYELILLGVGTVAVIIWVIAMWRRGGQYTGKMHRWLALLGIGFWCVVYMFVSDQAVDKRVVSTYFGNIAFAYEDYGLPYCFSASLFNTGIDEPNGYSQETMDNINKDGKLTETKTDSEKLPNIIFVQLESFFDPTEVEYYQLSEDPIPNLRKMFQNYSTGYFKVPSVGAGTANTEFEVLTGMNMRYFGPGEYPFKTKLKTEVCESAATALGELGYGTHALHNNGGNFYSRARVFNNMGFDSFTSKEFMNILQLTPNNWAKDDILVEHIMDAMDTDERQDFIFTVSVQGHGDYPTEKVLENPKIKVTGMEDEERQNAWEYYVNMIYEMDQFAQHLVEAVEARNEPSVIVFYGDHLPTMGLEAKDLKNRYLYNTNYVIWDNIGLEKEDRNIPSYQIMSDVFERLGIHSGTVFNYHQTRRQTKDYLKDLELLQYDILYGEKYVYNGDLPITEGHMRMGVKDVILTDIVPQLGEEDSYSLYGENFTKQSKIFVNDEQQESKFLNNTRVQLTDCKLEEGDIIKVVQMGSSSTVFHTSKKYVYQGGNLTLAPEEEQDQPGKNWVEEFEGTDEKKEE